MVGFAVASNNDTTYVYMARYDGASTGAIGVVNMGTSSDSVSGIVEMLYRKN